MRRVVLRRARTAEAGGLQGTKGIRETKASSVLASTVSVFARFIMALAKLDVDRGLATITEIRLCS